jgi:hypothetical protein
MFKGVPIKRRRDAEGPAKKTETVRERCAYIAARLLERMTDVQRGLCMDTHNMVSSCVPRRSGKTTGGLYTLGYTCLTVPGAVCPYGRETKIAAKATVWNELKNLDKEFAIGCEFKEVDRICVFPMGGTIQLFGLDNEAEVDKLRGLKFTRFLVDECQGIAPHILEYLLKSVIQPALMDFRGQVMFLGTPGEILVGPYFEATAPELHREIALRQKKNVDSMFWPRLYEDRNLPYWQGEGKDKFNWSLHRWTLEANTAVPHLWSEALKWKQINQWADDHPTWQREYLGRWVSDTSGKVYTGFDEDRNTWVPQVGPGLNSWGLPTDKDWAYIMGVDMGFNDPFTIVVWAYVQGEPTIYEVYEFGEPHMTTDDQFEKMNEVNAAFEGKIDIIVGDKAGGMGRATFEGWNERGLNIQAADKQNKRDYINLFNADLIAGRVKVIHGGTYHYQLRDLQWDEKSAAYQRGGYDVGRSQRDDACDAGLYIWRHALHHVWHREDIPSVVYNRRPEDYWAKGAVPPDPSESDGTVKEWWQQIQNEPPGHYVGAEDLLHVWDPDET